MATQWRVGMNGPTGLDYSVLPEMWRLFGVRQSERFEIFESLRVLESGALAVFGERDS